MTHTSYTVAELLFVLYYKAWTTPDTLSRQVEYSHSQLIISSIDTFIPRLKITTWRTCVDGWLDFTIRRLLILRNFIPGWTLMLRLILLFKSIGEPEITADANTMAGLIH